MQPVDKAVVRRSVLDLAAGKPRRSIDYEIRNNPREGREREDLWDTVTALGAQLSRPPFDPYRETVSLDTYIGRGAARVSLHMPILVYGHTPLPDAAQEALHYALNRLADDATTVGLVAETSRHDRKYPLFKRMNDHRMPDAEGLVVAYDGNLARFSAVRNAFDGPLLVEVDEPLADYVHQLLGAGADGIVVDTIQAAQGARYQGRHALAVIRDARAAVDAYYRGREHDGATLVVAGDVNNAGKMIKAAALGADVFGYATGRLIAVARATPDPEAAGNMIYRHMMGTKGELRGVPAAIGYSDFHNLSPADLRTSSIAASVQGDIRLEGVDRTYRELVNDVLDAFLDATGIPLNGHERTQLAEAVVGE